LIYSGYHLIYRRAAGVMGRQLNGGKKKREMKRKHEYITHHTVLWKVVVETVRGAGTGCMLYSGTQVHRIRIQYTMRMVYDTERETYYIV
jgi:hypothetical protein